MQDEERRNKPATSSNTSRYTPMFTTERPLGAYTPVGREVYISRSKQRPVTTIADGIPTHQYSSHWDPAFAKLQRLKYTERQDENPRTEWRHLIHFDRETVILAQRVQHWLCARSRCYSAAKKKRREAGEGKWTWLPVEERPPAYLDAGQGVVEGTTVTAICEMLQHRDQDQDQDKRHQPWYAVMLWLLANDPLSALDLLRATHQPPYPPLHAVQDSLRHLANIFHSVPDERTTSMRFQNLFATLRRLAHRSNGDTLSLPHGTLAQTLPNIYPEEQLKLWEAVQQHHVDVHWHTHLHFANYLATADHFDQALDAVSRAHQKGAILTSKPFLSTCSTLLRSSMRQPSGLRVCLRVVDHLVGMGVQLNLILCNIIMLNAVEAQDITTAWSIYHSLPNYGLQADAYTFAILLKACKVNLDDADMLNETIRNAIANMDVKKNSILAADILHTLALHHTKRNPEKVFETLADAYSQLFDTTPLSDLGILPPSQSSDGEKKMQPSHSAIGVMLTTYLDQLFLQTQSPTQPRALFHRYRALADSGVEPWASTIDKDYISNAFLVTLTKTKAGLLPAAEIIKTMQREPSPTDVVKKFKQCEPTVQSWTIFLHGFQRHGQMKMAEQVLQYMKNKGVEPDQVTWNVLVEGYAVLQDVEGVEGVLGRLKEGGRGWDEFTGSSVGKLRKGFGGRSGERSIGKELDFTGDLRQGLEKKIIEGVAEKEKKTEPEAEEAVGEAKYTPFV